MRFVPWVLFTIVFALIYTWIISIYTFVYLYNWVLSICSVHKTVSKLIIKTSSLYCVSYFNFLIFFYGPVMITNLHVCYIVVFVLFMFVYLFQRTSNPEFNAFWSRLSPAEVHFP